MCTPTLTHLNRIPHLHLGTAQPKVTQVRSHVCLTRHSNRHKVSLHQRKCGALVRNANARLRAIILKVIDLFYSLEGGIYFKGLLLLIILVICEVSPYTVFGACIWVLNNRHNKLRVKTVWALCENDFPMNLFKAVPITGVFCTVPPLS